jgi:hypothetical protein
MHDVFLETSYKLVDKIRTFVSRFRNLRNTRSSSSCCLLLAAAAAVSFCHLNSVLLGIACACNGGVCVCVLV